VRLNFSLKKREKRLLPKRLNWLLRRRLLDLRLKLNRLIRMPRLQKLLSKKKNKDLKRRLSKRLLLNRKPRWTS
jgi:hypothetical protein